MMLLLCGIFPAVPFNLALLLPALAVCALLLDAVLGEPSRWHPLVGFGRWAGWLEKTLNRFPTGFAGTAVGAVALLLALTPWLLVVGVLVWLLQQSVWLWLVAEVLLLYLCIGWQSLQLHLDWISQALTAGDLPQAREKLGWIVSRDTQQLSDDEVAQAGIESLLENSADALFVSLFWFALGGSALALLHRWVNTLDAMWGYRNERYEYFGKCAARLDDVMAYIPARLTALVMALASGRYFFRAMRCWRTQAQYCSSPNGGVVMTTGAGAVGVRLSERACYLGEWKTKPVMGCGPLAGVKDITAALSLVKRTLWLWMGLWAALCIALSTAVAVGVSYAA